MVGIPYGGGKGGVSVNPKELSRMELERLSRGFIAKIAPFIGPVAADAVGPSVVCCGQAAEGRGGFLLLVGSASARGGDQCQHSH